MQVILGCSFLSVMLRMVLQSWIFFVNMPVSVLDYMDATTLARGHSISLLRADLPGEMIPRARSPRSGAGLPCTLCGQLFADDRAVQIHYSLTHARGRPFTVDVHNATHVVAPKSVTV